MKIPFGKPLIDSKERMAVQKVLSGNILVHGPKIIEFEKKFSEFTKIKLFLRSFFVHLWYAFILLRSRY